MVAKVEYKQNSLFIPQPAEIVRAERLTEKETFYELRLLSGKELGHEPGQFVEVSVFGIGEAPISISSSPTKTDGFELVVRNVGNVTGALANMKAGDQVGIRGPFGIPFPVNELRGNDVLFVAGGLGLVPSRSLINNVLDEREDFGQVTILYGTKCYAEQLFRDELYSWAQRDDVDFRATCDVGDDEWTGNVGVITTLFPGLEFNPKTTYAIVVGPPIMFRFVIKELLGKGMPEDRIILSLERRMKCGVGKCGHCQINGVYVCQDGPTFTYAELKTLEEAFA